VFSVDGLWDTEAQAASKHLASRLSAKQWKWTYSEVPASASPRIPRPTLLQNFLSVGLGNCPWIVPLSQ
jgi:hypothetical protein